MKGPSYGKYWIRLAQQPKPYAGADHPHLESPVITDGNHRVWEVTPLSSGKYTIALITPEGKLFLQDEETLNVGLVPYAWTIAKVGDHYVIEVPSMVFPPRGLTVRDTAPKKPITVDVYEFPRPNQLWDFIRWPGPEE